MESEKLVELLEKYSNAILAFMVLQSIAFSFTYGTNSRFGCLVKNEDMLAFGLVAHFAISTALACAATILIGRGIRQVLQHSAMSATILKRIYLAKLVVIVLFAAIPILLLFAYGISDVRDPQLCVGR